MSSLFQHKQISSEACRYEDSLSGFSSWAAFLLRMYNPQNDFLGYSETKRPKFKAEKKNEMVFWTSNTQTESSIKKPREKHVISRLFFCVKICPNQNNFVPLQQLDCLTLPSYIEVKFHVFITFEQTLCPIDVVLIDVNISKVQRDWFQRQINLSGHQIEMVNVRRQTQICVAASLVCRND